LAANEGYKRPNKTFLGTFDENNLGGHCVGKRVMTSLMITTYKEKYPLFLRH